LPDAGGQRGGGLLRQGGGRTKRQAFFFEKKKQKTFSPAPRHVGRFSKLAKFFGSSSKKNCFPAFAASSGVDEVPPVRAVPLR
jgi:hypothetical protein